MKARRRANAVHQNLIHNKSGLALADKQSQDAGGNQGADRNAAENGHTGNGAEHQADQQNGLVTHQRHTARGHPCDKCADGNRGKHLPTEPVGRLREFGFTRYQGGKYADGQNDDADIQAVFFQLRQISGQRCLLHQQQNGGGNGQAAVVAQHAQQGKHHQKNGDVIDLQAHYAALATDLTANSRMVRVISLSGSLSKQAAAAAAAAWAWAVQ